MLSARRFSAGFPVALMSFSLPAEYLSRSFGWKIRAVDWTRRMWQCFKLQIQISRLCVIITQLHAQREIIPAWLFGRELLRQISVCSWGWLMYDIHKRSERELRQGFSRILLHYERCDLLMFITILQTSMFACESASQIFILKLHNSKLKLIWRLNHIGLWG